MKPAPTYDQQLERLRGRNLVIDDEDAARSYLMDTNYYRFSAYARPFQIAPGDGGNDNFSAGTTFDTARALADFDSQLRKLVLGGLETIEIAIRAHLAYSIAIHDDPVAYGDGEFYQSAHCAAVIDAITDDIDRAREVYLDHHDRVNGAQTWPPIWVTTEALSFGTLSKMLTGAKSGRHVGHVARRWNLNAEFFKSLVHHYVYIRSVCAHHNRLWNRELSVQMKDFQSATHPLMPRLVGSSKVRMYRTLVFLCFMLKKLDPASTFEQDILALIDKDRFKAQGMGFPSTHTLDSL